MENENNCSCKFTITNPLKLPSISNRKENIYLLKSSQTHGLCVCLNLHRHSWNLISSWRFGFIISIVNSFFFFKMILINLFFLSYTNLMNFFSSTSTINENTFIIPQRNPGLPSYYFPSFPFLQSQSTVNSFCELLLCMFGS